MILRNYLREKNNKLNIYEQATYRQISKFVNFYQNIFDENETTLESCFNLTSSKYCSSLDEVGWSS